MYLYRALAVSRQTGDSTLTAVILNNLGNLLVAQQKNAEAIAAYKESATLAKQAGHPLLRARALTNAATTLRQTGAQDLGSDAASDELWARGDPRDRSRPMGSLIAICPYRRRRGSALPASGCHRGRFRLTSSVIAVVSPQLSWEPYETEGRHAEALS
jgi:hypothetical protein